MAQVELSSEVRKRAALRRAKSVAVGILIVAAAIYVASTVALLHGGGDWLGFVQAAAEAGMVGGLADWFAVTALFRRPLGLPIPHTAIIPTRKDQMGASLGDFVGSNFLADDVVREKIRSLRVSYRLGRWIAQPANARRASDELAVGVRAALALLRDDEIKAALESLARERLANTDIGPPLGNLLEQIVADGAHHPTVSVLAERAREWVVGNRALIVEIIGRQAPDWSPRFADELVAGRVHSELVKFVTAIQENPNHQVRLSIDRMLQELSWDLRHNPEMRARVNAAKMRMIEHPELKDAVGTLWLSAKSMLIEASENPDSQLRTRVTAEIAHFGTRLAEDPGTASKTDQMLEDAVLHVVSNYRGELTAVITDTVARWDGQETAQKIELQVGRDLQFIRINGTVVGSLTGLAIHSATYLLS